MPQEAQAGSQESSNHVSMITQKLLTGVVKGYLIVPSIILVQKVIRLDEDEKQDVQTSRWMPLTQKRINEPTVDWNGMDTNMFRVLEARYGKECVKSKLLTELYDCEEKLQIIRGPPYSNSIGRLTTTMVMPFFLPVTN